MTSKARVRRRVLITGATSGLGREMAIQLARQGCRIAITGRRLDKLQAVARAVEDVGGECIALAGSVTQRDAARQQYATIRQRWEGLDWAILNAGVGDLENARQFSAENYHRTFATNVGGAVNWMEAVLPDMLAAKSGTIAGIASLAGLRGLPQSGAYSSSKAALITLLESTRLDLRGTGVDIVIVCPGFVKSELTDRNDPKKMPFLMEVEDGARSILEGIERKRRIVHFPWQISYLMLYGVRNMPGWLYDRIMGRLAKRRKKSYEDPNKAQSQDWSL